MTIHQQFIKLCDSLYLGYMPPLRKKQYFHRSLAYSTTLLFSKHLFVTKQLTNDWNNLDTDLKTSKQTPATLLALALYSRPYINLLINTQIHKHMRMARDILELIPKKIQCTYNQY